MLGVTGVVDFSLPMYWLPSRGKELGAGKGPSRRSEEEDSVGGHGGSPEEREGGDENPQGARGLSIIGYI